MFYFIHVQGQNALTTLLHLADEMTVSAKITDHPGFEPGTLVLRLRVVE